jgi:integrase
LILNYKKKQAKSILIRFTIDSSILIAGSLGSSGTDAGIERKDRSEGPYKERKKFMKTLCKKVDVRYFRFHALRHFGASVLDSANIGSIQRILGHENRTTTEIYLHSIGESERKAMAIYTLFTEKSRTDCTKKKKRS